MPRISAPGGPLVVGSHQGEDLCMCSATSSTVGTEEQAFHAVGGQKYNTLFPVTCCHIRFPPKDLFSALDFKP